jgi:hypothetical protein
MYPNPMEQLKAGFEVPSLQGDDELKLYFRLCRIHLLSTPMEQAIASMSQRSSVSNLVNPAGNGVPIDTGGASTGGAVTGSAATDSAATAVRHVFLKQCLTSLLIMRISKL